MQFNDMLHLMLSWEDGTIAPEDEDALFQHLLNSGHIHKLQGFYGRHTQLLLDSGRIIG
jgi:hypothetical protein